MDKGKTYTGRSIQNETFLRSLQEGQLHKMLKVVKADQSLDVQIRENYLTIYYKGGAIAKIKGEKSVEFDERYFNLDGKQNDNEKLNTLFEDGKYQEYFTKAKEVMDAWFEQNPNPERSKQQEITKANSGQDDNYTIIDIEYQVSTICEFAYKGKKPRFDIIAVNRQNELCVIELKKGTASLQGKSGLKAHWECYQGSIGLKPVPFVEEMDRLLKQKQAFGLIGMAVAIKKSLTPVFMFAYAYDDKLTRKRQYDRFEEERESIKGIPVITVEEETNKLIDEWKSPYIEE